MDRALRPARLEISTVNEESSKRYVYWEKTFQNYISTLEDANNEQKKLMVLTNNISMENFDIIQDCTTYTEALEKLKKHYVKKKNSMFARHVLLSRKQGEESLEEYLCVLNDLSRSCDYKSVDAETYRNESVMIAFIKGIKSGYIRQKILEDQSENMTLDKVIQTALVIEGAQKNSEAFNHMSVGAHQVAAVDKSRFNENNNDKICSFCGYPWHQRRIDCPAYNATCHHCGVTGHFSRVCIRKEVKKGNSNQNVDQRKSKGPNNKKHLAGIGQPGTEFQDNNSSDEDSWKPNSTHFMPKLASIGGTSVIEVKVNNLKANALIDTGSMENYIHPKIVQRLKLEIVNKKGQVALANGKVVETMGLVKVRLDIEGKIYNNVVLVILPCAIEDLILGREFQKRHSEVIFKFGGNLPPLVCSLGVLNIEPPQVFANLSDNCHPIAAKSRRYSETDKAFIKGEVQRLLKENIIQKSTSPWRAQVLVVKKENQKRRLGIDYSETINKFTYLDAYPLPRIDDIIQNIAKYKVFSTIDLRSAYHQIPLNVKDREYTAFEADGGLYEFMRMPWGVTNGTSVFQREMDKFVSDFGLQATYPYLDNVTICGVNKQDHDINLRKFREAALKFNLTYNEDKCVFATTKLSLLGVEIENGEIKPDPERLQPLLNLPPPVNKKSLMRVMGFFAYYSQWIKDFSNKISFLKNIESFPLGEQELDAFQELKNEVAKSVLWSVNENLKFTVETDASDEAMAATLNQNGRPVAFFSRSFKGSEMNQASVEKEAQAIVEAVKKWQHYLLGKHFEIVTDQRSVSFMFGNSNKKIKNEKLLRWRMELSCFSYDIIYRPGKDNIPADMLSRNVCCAMFPPKLYELHDALCHPGVTRMFHFVKIRNLPFSLEDVKNMTKNCKWCSLCKPQFYKPVQGHLIKATQPFERLNVDFKGPLPSNNKNIYFFQIIDEYSRFPFVYPCQDVKASTIIKCLSDLFAVFGMPMYIHSDRGSSLMSTELKTFCNSKGISTSRTTPYNPEGNGLVEKSNGTIWRSILVSLKSKNLPESAWQLVLPDVMHSIRTLLCTATNTTPHERLFGFNRRSGTGTSLPTWLSEPGSVLIRRYVRNSKNDPLVDEVDLLEANPQYAHVKFKDGREDTVSIRDLAPKGNYEGNTQELYEQNNSKIVETEVNSNRESENNMFSNFNVEKDEDFRDQPAGLMSGDVPAPEPLGTMPESAAKILEDIANSLENKQMRKSERISRKPERFQSS